MVKFLHFYYIIHWGGWCSSRIYFMLQNTQDQDLIAVFPLWEESQPGLKWWDQVWYSLWQESRSREKRLEKLLIFFSLDLENWTFISLFLLDFQEFENQILVHFSNFKTFKKKFSFSSRFMRFWRKNPFLFSIIPILIGKILFLLSMYEIFPIISLSLLL